MDREEVVVNLNDVAFVVQGPVFYDKNKVDRTIDVLDRISILSPESQVIFSTWKGTKLNERYKSYLVVESEDPGALTGDFGVNNVNRQIVGTIAGLEKVSSKYVVKLRSDLYLNSLSFLNYMDLSLNRDSSKLVFSDYILSVNTTAKNANKWLKRSFHPSDWLHFGLVSDLVKLFDIPLCSGQHANISQEQYIWMSCLLKSGMISDYSNYKSKSMRGVSDSLLVNNIMLFDYSKKYMTSMKLGYNPPLGVNGFAALSRCDWENLYDEYVERRYNNSKFVNALEIVKQYVHFLRWYLLINPLLKVKKLFDRL